MAPAPRTKSHSTVTIRPARAADASAIARLAQLDSARAPLLEAVLVAEVDGELRAAVPLGGGPTIADPFHHTAELVAMLRVRKRQLTGAGSRSPTRRRRSILLRRPAPAAGRPIPGRGFGG